MKSQWENGQAEAADAIEAKQAALAKQETQLRAQKAELARMMGELKQMQEAFRKQPRGDAGRCPTRMAPRPRPSWNTRNGSAC